jgi:hypothetical protein
MGGDLALGSYRDRLTQRGVHGVVYQATPQRKFCLACGLICIGFCITFLLREWPNIGIYKDSLH